MKFLLIGLGNIGQEYSGTRHNIGFDVVDALGEKFAAEWVGVKHGSLARFSHGGSRSSCLNQIRT